MFYSDMYLKEQDRITAEQNIRALMLSLTSRMAELGPLKPKIEEFNEADYFFNFRIHTFPNYILMICTIGRLCARVGGPFLFTK